MTEHDRPNPASDKHRAEGERHEERDRPHDANERASESEGGISNRPADEEKGNQESVPARGERKGNTHA